MDSVFISMGQISGMFIKEWQIPFSYSANQVICSNSLLYFPGKSSTANMQPETKDNKYGGLASKLVCNSGMQQDDS